jgi:uncharacterized protein (TIGR03435 family)
MCRPIPHRVFPVFPAGARRTILKRRAPANAVPAGLPESERRGRMQAMIRGLLTERFKLVMRVEQKTMPVYALSVATGGPKFQKSTIADKDCILDTGTPESCHDFTMGRGHPLNARAINMDDLAQYIENWTDLPDLPVVNRTAVTGLFAVEPKAGRPCGCRLRRQALRRRRASTASPQSSSCCANSVSN